MEMRHSENRGKMEVCDAWCDRMRDLLKMEHEEEAAATEAALGSKNSRALEAKGVRLRGLAVEGVEVGLSGRTMVKLVPKGTNAEAVLPAHRFSVGDTVMMTPMGEQDSEGSHGVVTRVKKNSVTVALNKDEQVAMQLYRLDLLADDVSYRRMVAALDQLRIEEASSLKRVLFGETVAPQFAQEAPWTPIDPGLNESQREAISLSLRARHVSVIHGPPGTGKTTTVAELIKQFLVRGERVLAVAPSNIAVDNLLEKVSSFEPEKYRPLRLGHPARLLPSVLPFAMENVLLRSVNASLCTDIRVEMRELALKQTKASDWGERKAMQNEFRQLRKDLRERERKAVDEVLRGSRVVFATLTGCADRLLRDLAEPFDVVVIDEAAQALEPACWIAMLRAKRVVLAGDHMQLPPTVTSTKAQTMGLAATLLDRVVKWFGDDVTRMLDTQYRMHETIMGFSSHELYADKLRAHASVAAHLLTELPSVVPGDEDEDDLLSFPLVFFDIAGCGLDESQEEEASSRENKGEAELVAKHVQQLLSRGVAQSDVAVITPYNAQVQLVRSLIGERFPNVEVGSVDGFQGREKEAVVISLVRSNKKGQVGFLSDFRRMNVAITRARRHCCIFGNSLTIVSDPFLKKLVDYLEQAEYISVQTGEAAEAPRVAAPVITVAAPQIAAHGQPRKLVTPAFEKEIASLLKKFYASDPKERFLHLDASYNTAQRRLVHEVAETMTAKGCLLYHRSIGEGDSRRICVSKDPFPVAEIEWIDVVVTAPKREDVVVADGKEEMANANVSDNGESVAVVEEKKRSAKVPTVQLKKKKKKKKKQAPVDLGPSLATLNDDRILDEALAKRKHGLCHFGGCSVVTSIVMVYTTCRHCANAFCTSHSLPEVHGCGDAAAKAARKEWLAKSQQAQEAAKPGAKPPLSQAKKEVLKNVLHKKLQDAQQSRAPKASKKK